MEKVFKSRAFKNMRWAWQFCSSIHTKSSITFMGFCFPVPRKLRAKMLGSTPCNYNCSMHFVYPAPLETFSCSACTREAELRSIQNARPM